MNEFQKRIGVGEPSRLYLRKAGTSKTSPVIKEEGRNRGNVGGKQTEHWDGRVDSVVVPDPINLKVSKSEQKILSVEV